MGSNSPEAAPESKFPGYHLFPKELLWSSPAEAGRKTECRQERDVENVKNSIRRGGRGENSSLNRGEKLAEWREVDTQEYWDRSRFESLLTEDSGAAEDSPGRKRAGQPPKKPNRKDAKEAQRAQRINNAKYQMADYAASRRDPCGGFWII